MKKSQALIIQFVIFFLIGLSFFLTSGMIFRFQSDLIRRDVITSGTELTSDYVSSYAIASVDSCRSCDNVTVKLNVKTAAGYSPILKLDNGMVTSVQIENINSQSGMHNLLQSVNYETREVSSAKPITLTYDRTNNNLVIK